MKRFLSAVATMTVLTVSAQTQAPPKVHPVLAAPPGAGEVGRYVIGQVSDIRADQYLLDTKTGRVWQLVNMNMGDGKSVSGWQEMPLFAPDGKMSYEPPR